MWALVAGVLAGCGHPVAVHPASGPQSGYFPVTIDVRWQLNLAGPGSIFIESDVDTEVTDS